MTLFFPIRSQEIKEESSDYDDLEAERRPRPAGLVKSESFLVEEGSMRRKWRELKRIAADMRQRARKAARAFVKREAPAAATVVKAEEFPPLEAVPFTEESEDLHKKVAINYERWRIGEL